MTAIASARKSHPSSPRLEMGRAAIARHKLVLLSGNNFRSKGTNLIVWHKENVCGTMGKNRGKMNPIHFNLCNTDYIFN